MKFTELTVTEFNNFVQNPPLESHYSQVKEDIVTRGNDGFGIVLLGIGDNNSKVITASPSSKIPIMGSYVYYSNRGPVMNFLDLGLVDYYLKELDKYLQQHQCLYVKLDPCWLYHLYDKNIVPFEDREKNDALIGLFKSHGYEHHGFTAEYDTLSQVRWMGILDLEGKTPETLKKTFDNQRKRNINKAINYGVKVRFLERDEFNLFLDLYHETEECAGFVSKTDGCFYNFINTYGDKVLVPLAYIDPGEYVLKLQQELDDKGNRRDQIMAKENESDKRMKKIAELDKQIGHSQHELLNVNELNKADGPILNLASGVYFANAYEVSYFSGGSSEKCNQFIGPCMMHRFMIDYCFGNGYDRYNFYGLSGDFTENNEDYGVYRFRRGFNVQIGELIGDFYKPIHKVKYWLLTTLGRLREKLKKQM